jgi:hypothetical protein
MITEVGKFFKYFWVLVVIAITLNACYYDKADSIYPDITTTTCDTVNITYSNQVSGIINANCNNCHASALANSIGGGINLGTYTAMKPYITNGSFLNSILHNGQAAPMPKNASKLSSCNILVIQTWINKGALNN